jgi:NhaP-type Na+/H+ or K+/H+ antiporter
MAIGFGDALLVFGALLAIAAALSGLMHGTVLSISVLAVALGVILAEAGVVTVHARDQAIVELVELALILTLFSDGLLVERELLRVHWGPVTRAIVLAMPITLGLLGLAGHALFTDLGWAQAFLLAAVLSPTDPVVTSSVVTSRRVPADVRHTLNLESGLNDGLALPAVLAFLAALTVGSEHFVWWRFVVQDIGLGFLYGLACGWVASLLMPRDGARGQRDLERSIPSHQKSLYALGVAFGTYGVTVLAPSGNGFIAVFVAAIVLGIRRPDLRLHFEQRADEIVEIVKLGVFLVFGSLLTLQALFNDGWAAVALVLVTFLIARPLAVWIALLRTPTDAGTRLFMGWFGPKGVATMTFSLIVLDQGIPSAQRIFDLTALVVFTSIIVHGLTDTPGANWIARHSAEADQA